VEQTPAAADFELVDRPMPNVRDGALLVRVLVQSLDPYIGTRLRGRHMGEPRRRPGRPCPASPWAK
jgi:NADPH-dependent curcumin reductase CurA